MFLIYNRSLKTAIGGLKLVTSINSDIEPENIRKPIMNSPGFASNIFIHTAISIKVVHEQSGKVEYERERLQGIVNKLMNFQSDSQQPFALIFDFSALLVDNLN